MKHPSPSTVSSRKRSWITHTEIAHEFPCFVDKCAEIIFDPEYSETAKNYARGILDFLMDWDYVSWKQFDSIFRIVAKKHQYASNFKNGTYVSSYRDVVSMKRGNAAMSFKSSLFSGIPDNDKDFDDFHELIFGTRPYFEEEENGYSVSYSKSGKRYFTI